MRSDAYRLAYPTTSYDISGRMSDSPPVAIPFKPWGEAKPRSPQGMGAGTGMPGILKAGMPMERPMDWKGAFEEAGRMLGRAAGLDTETEESEPQRSAAAPWMPSPSAGNQPDPAQPNDETEPGENGRADASAPIEIDLERYWRTDHDGWQGTVEDMAKQVGIDQELFGDASAEAQIALAGAVAFRHLDKQQQRDVLTLIMNLEQGEDTRLAHRLRGYVAEQHSLGGMRHPETMSRKELEKAGQYYQNMEEISQKAQSVLEQIDSLPIRKPKHATVVIKVLVGLAELSKAQADLSQQSLEEESQRRQR